MDGAAVLAHLTRGRSSGAHGGGYATMDGINIHGPAVQLEVVRPATEVLGTQYYETYGGFSWYPH